MRGSKYFVVLVLSTIVLLGLAATIKPTKAATAPVRIYVDQPLGYLPFQTPGTKFTFTINIATSGIADGTAAGIIQWKMDIRVDPNVLDINTTVGSPPPFPPPYSAKFSTGPGHFLTEFASMMGYTPPSLFLGTNDPLTGYQDEISETGIPSYALGAGDYISGLYPTLLTVEITSKSNTQGCLIDLIDVMYRTGDGLWHNAEQVEDGYYGGPFVFPMEPNPFYMSYQGSLFPGGDPTGTTWHELYPTYCRYYDVIGWIDNGDGDLTASDQIDMVNETGWIYHYHVDKVTTTIHWTYKTGPVYPDDLTTELAASEPIEPNLLQTEIGDPIGTNWHQIYPPDQYSKEFVITSWTDNGDGVFSVSDQFDFEYFGEGTIYWAHLDDVTTDIILSQKGEPEPPVSEFPWGLGLMMMIAPAIPIVYLWRTRKKEW